MSFYEWLCILGIPSLVAAVVTAGIKFVLAQIKGIKLGVQALLRAQMIAEYNKWEEKGYAPIYARQNFENCWVQYHSLGANGVMDDIHKKFLKLPTEPKNKEENEDEN